MRKDSGAAGVVLLAFHGQRHLHRCFLVSFGVSREILTGCHRGRTDPEYSGSVLVHPSSRRLENWMIGMMNQPMTPV